MRIVTFFPILLFLTNLHAQTNCPNHDDKAPAPLALVSSPLMTLHTGQSESVLNLPTRIYVSHNKYGLLWIAFLYCFTDFLARVAARDVIEHESIHVKLFCRCVDFFH